MKFDCNEFARDYAAAVNAGDPSKTERYYTPDSIFWHNTDETILTLKDRKTLSGWLHKAMKDINWRVKKVLPTPEGCVLEGVMDCTSREAGKPVHVNVCLVFSVNDNGKIYHTNEYADSGSSARGRAQPWQDKK